MFSVRARFFNVRNGFQCMVKWSSSNSSIFPLLTLQPKLSDTDHEKILDAINEPDNRKLLGLNVAKNRIKSLESYKKRKGPFKSVDELLEVDGLNLKILEKLCMQIISDVPNPQGKFLNTENKRIKHLLTPPLPPNVTESLISAVGIHISSVGVSWAKILKTTGELESWGHRHFGNLPKKLSPLDTFTLAMEILNQLPCGDAYVFEGTNSMSPQSPKQASAITSYTLQLELSSMLLALINTSTHHNKTYLGDPKESEGSLNCVYYLRSKVAARLFRTLIGNECVSSMNTILHILGEPSDDIVLPCSPVTVDYQLKSDYLAQPPAHKELLGQALMLTIAFRDLCVIKNSESIKAVLPGKK